MSRPASSRSAVIAAIDFGTTGTALAYYLRQKDKTMTLNDIDILLNVRRFSLFTQEIRPRFSV